MTRVEELESRVESLSAAEYQQFRRWFIERDWAQWDREIEEDSASGKLDFLLREAEDAQAAGTLRDL
jgi:hypothetical protein